MVPEWGPPREAKGGLNPVTGSRSLSTNQKEFKDKMERFRKLNLMNAKVCSQEVRADELR